MSEFNNKKADNSYDQLKTLAKDKIILFKNQNGDLFFRGGEADVKDASDDNIKNYLRLLYEQNFHKPVGEVTLTSIAKLMISQAELDAECVQTASRVFFDKESETIFYDIGDENRTVYSISSEGIKTCENPPVVFLRKKTMNAQVIPDLSCKTRSEAKEILFKLKSFINVSEDNLFLIIVYIISAFKTDISHPILVLLGGAGTSKTTTSRLLSAIVDPNKNDVLQFPSQNNLEVILSNRYFVTFDNIGDKTISKDISNLFCCAVTGATTVRRALYTDSEEKSLTLRNTIVLNGINLSIFKVDLLTRSIVIKMGPISEEKRKTESELFAKFNSYLPKLLGAIFFVLKETLGNNEPVTDLSRMADFEQFAYKVAEAIEDGGGARFQALYHNQLESNHKEALMVLPIVEFVHDYISRFGNVDGTPEDVFNTIKYKSNCEYMPKATNSFVRKLNDNREFLAEIGIHFETGHSTRRYLKIWSDNSEENDSADEVVYSTDVTDNDLNF